MIHMSIKTHTFIKSAQCQLRSFGTQPSICISAGQPGYLFFAASEWLICAEERKELYLFAIPQIFNVSSLSKVL